MHKGGVRRIKALMTKEFYQIIRDPSSILISLILPAILLFLYGFGISLDMKHLRIGVVLEETTPEVQSFVQDLDATSYLDVVIGRDRREFDRAIAEGSIKGVVVIPAYFSAFKERKDNIAPIQVIADGSEPNTATFVQNYVQAAFANWLVQEEISNGLNDHQRILLQNRFWYNESLESRDFLIPGSLAIIMTLIGTLLTALVIAREWERGSMEAMMATPVRMMEVVIAKLLSYFVLGMISFTLSVVLSLILFHIPLRSSLLVLAGVAAIFLWTALGLGLLISTIAKNQFVASQAAIISAFLPAFILSGFIYEITSMPTVIQWIAYCIPARYFVNCLQTLFLVGPVWRLILHNIVMMIIIGSIFFAITAHKTIKRLD